MQRQQKLQHRKEIAQWQNEGKRQEHYTKNKNPKRDNGMKKKKMPKWGKWNWKQKFCCVVAARIA